MGAGNSGRYLNTKGSRKNIIDANSEKQNKCQSMEATGNNNATILDNSVKYKEVIENLPKNSDMLLKDGWKEVTPKGMSQNTTSKMYFNESKDLTIRFDKGQQNMTGFANKDHYHVFNPNATNKQNYYLDKNGCPTAKNSKASHIIPKE